MKLFDLYDHLKASGVTRPEQLVCELDAGNADASLSTAGAGLLLYRHRYTGRIGLEKAHGSLEHLIALCVAWIDEFGGDSDHNRFAGWVGEPADDRLSDIDLRFEFEEEIHYNADPDYVGADKLTWKGTVYKRDAPVADRADTLTAVIAGGP